MTTSPAAQSQAAKILLLKRIFGDDWEQSMKEKQPVPVHTPVLNVTMGRRDSLVVTKRRRLNNDDKLPTRALEESCCVSGGGGVEIINHDVQSKGTPIRPIPIRGSINDSCLQKVSFGTPQA